MLQVRGAALLIARAACGKVASYRDSIGDAVTSMQISKRPVRSDDAKTRLILAAEILFAKGGIEGVSLREIAAAAGQRNHHAVQYHFGIRDTLVQAVFDYRMDQMEAARGAMLAAAEASGRLDDTRSIVETMTMHPDDMQEMGLTAGDKVRVRTEHGEAQWISSKTHSVTPLKQ